MDINEMMYKIHNNSQDKGWWQEERTFGEIIALCHSELSEALEEYRNGHAVTEMYYSGSCASDCSHCKGDCDFHGGMKKPEGVAVELADCIIRILDFCGYAGIDIENAIQIKHDYNKTRPWRHNGKVI